MDMELLFLIEFGTWFSIKVVDGIQTIPQDSMENYIANPIVLTLQ